MEKLDSRFHGNDKMEDSCFHGNDKMEGLKMEKLDSRFHGNDKKHHHSHGSGNIYYR